MPSEQKWINNWKTWRRKAEADFFFILSQKGASYTFLKIWFSLLCSCYLCFSYESRKSFLPWILPPFSPRTFEFPLEKEEKENIILPFPRCPLLILNDLWIKRKEWSWILFFGCLRGSDWKLGSHENEKSFFWWVILCMSHCCVKLPVLSCPFPEGHVYWGGLPTPACPLCDTVICISLLMAVLSDFRMAPGWAVRSCCSPWGSGRRSAGALAHGGSQLRCWCAWLCLTLVGLVGPLSGFAFFPASASNLFTPNTSLIEVIVSVLLWNRMAGVCSLPCGHIWVIWPLTSQLITTFKTTKQCWGSRLGLYWWTRW